MAGEIQGGPSEADKAFIAPTTEIQSPNPTNMPELKPNNTPKSKQEVSEQTTPEQKTVTGLQKYLEHADKQILGKIERPLAPTEKIKARQERIRQMFDATNATEEAKQELEEELKGMEIPKDHVTGLPTRGDQNAYIEQAIWEATHNGTPETVALLNIDVNDLKVVNDAGDHDAGDDFLKGICKTLKESLEDISRSIKGLEFQIGRDGGDEFSICIKGNTNLNQKLEEMDSETLHLLMQDPLIKEIAGKDKGSSLINIINKYVSRKCSEQNYNHVFLTGKQKELHEKTLKTDPESAKAIARKAMQEKLFKLKPEKGAPPTDLEFVSYVSMDGATLADIKKAPDANNFKDFHKGETAIKSANSALETIMGALRTHTDRMAKEDKRRLKTGLAESQSAADKYRGTIGRPISVDQTIATIQEGMKEPITGESLEDALNRLANSL